MPLAPDACKHQELVVDVEPVYGDWIGNEDLVPWRDRADFSPDFPVTLFRAPEFLKYPQTNRAFASALPRRIVNKSEAMGI
jgi:hypothetical protein